MALGLPGPSRELSLLKTLSLIPQPQRPCEMAYLRDLDGTSLGLLLSQHTGHWKQARMGGKQQLD